MDITLGCQGDIFRKRGCAVALKHHSSAGTESPGPSGGAGLLLLCGEDRINPTASAALNKKRLLGDSLCRSRCEISDAFSQHTTAANNNFYPQITVNYVRSVPSASPILVSGQPGFPRLLDGPFLIILGGCGSLGLASLTRLQHGFGESSVHPGWLEPWKLSGTRYWLAVASTMHGFAWAPCTGCPARILILWVWLMVTRFYQHR